MVKPSINKEQDVNSDEVIQQATKIDRTLNLLNTLEPLITYMERLVEIEKKFQMMLYEPQLLFRYRKDFVGFLIALRLYNRYKSERVSGDEAKIIIQQVSLYDTEFSNEIKNVLPNAGENFGPFLELLNELKRGRQYFVYYISTHARELTEQAKSISAKDIKLSKHLVELLSAISGHEIDSLMQCRSDCEDWLHYAVEYNIDFFMSRINLFLNGGPDKSSGGQFKGLYKDFGDDKIQGIMLRNNSVRNLGSYLNQVKYLNLLISMCRRAYVSGDWNNGFFGKRGFWTDFKRYATDFEIVYGNVDFKERLIATEKKKEYELPQFWGGVWERSEVQDVNTLRQQGILYIVEGSAIYILRKDGVLTRLLRELSSRRYQINKVINPAAAALIKIFEERENELIANRNEKVRDLIKILLDMFGVPQLRNFRRLLKKKKTLLVEELKKDMDELISKSTDPLSDYAAISEENKNPQSTLGKISADYLSNVTGNLVRARDKQLAFVYWELETGQFLKKGDIRGLTFLGIAEKSAAKLQARKISYERFEHLSDDDFGYLQNLIPRVQEIIRRFIEIYNYIKYKMGQRFAIQAEALEVLDIDFDNRKNRDFELYYVKKMFDRLI